MEAPDIDVTMAQRQAADAGADLSLLFQSTRTAASVVSGVFTVGTRADRTSAVGEADGDRWKESDTGWLYYYDAGWHYEAGLYSATDAQRAALTISADDNGAWLLTTDTDLFWQVAAGAWVLRGVTATGLRETAGPTELAMGTVADGEFLKRSGATVVGDTPASGYTDEQAQDAVGTILADTATIDFTYTDGTPEIKADVKDGSVTYAKMQDVSATDRLLGRSTAGAGDVEEIACTTAGRALLDDADAAAQRATLGVGVMLHVSSSGANVGTSETDMATYTMPGGTLSTGKVLRITAFGTTAANANTKTVRLRFGGTEIGRPMNANAANNASWSVTNSYVIATGAATQNAWVRTSQNTTNALGTNENANNLFNSSPTETLSGSIVIKVTGQSNTASNDVLLKGFIVELLN
jgi:hypothetical protein